MSADSDQENGGPEASNHMAATEGTAEAEPEADLEAGAEATTAAAPEAEPEDERPAIPAAVPEQVELARQADKPAVVAPSDAIGTPSLPHLDAVYYAFDTL